jgi:hypothetical protein
VELFVGFLATIVGAVCGCIVLFHAAMNESWNKSCAWLLTGAGFVYYVIFWFDNRFKWLVASGAVVGLGLGGTLLLKGMGLGV